MDAILRRIVGILEFVEQIYETVHSHGGWRTRRRPRFCLMHAWMNGSVSMDGKDRPKVSVQGKIIAG